MPMTERRDVDEFVFILFADRGVQNRSWSNPFCSCLRRPARGNMFGMCHLDGADQVVGHHHGDDPGGEKAHDEPWRHRGKHLGKRNQQITYRVHGSVLYTVTN